MSIRPLSIMRRGIADRTLRLSQPVPWSDGFSLSVLAVQDSTTSATSSATANTAGSWVQLFAAAATSASDTIAALWVNLQTTNSSATADNSVLVDFATGISGSEVAFVSDIAVGGLQNGWIPLLLPVRIPGNTRVAFRVRGATASRVYRTQIGVGASALLTSPFSDRLPTSLDVLGTSQSTSAGTACSGASGGWNTVLSASTPKDYQAVILVPSGPGNGTSITAQTSRLDLGLGPSGSEVQIATSSFQHTGTTGFVAPLLAGGFGLAGRFVPAGSRLSLRHSLSANPQAICGCVIGVPYV